MNSKNLFYLSALNLLFSLNVIGQNTIKFHFDENEPDSNIISFIDKANSKVLKAFSLIQFSPYWNLPFPEYEDIDKKSKSFDLRNCKFDFNEIPGQINFEGIHKSIPDYGFTYSALNFSSNHNFVIVYHHLLLYSDQRRYGYCTTMQIYDSIGNLINKLEASDKEIRDPFITDDGKYIAYRFGIELDDEGITWSDIGYRIIELKTKKLVTNKLIKFSNIDNDLSLSSEGNLFWVSYTEQNKYDSLHVKIYNPGKSECYSALFSKIQIKSLKKITPDGLIFTDNSSDISSKQLITYENGFSKEVIK